LARQPKSLVFGGFAVVMVLVVLLMLALQPDPTTQDAPVESGATGAPGQAAPRQDNEQVVADRLRAAQAQLDAGDLDGALDQIRQALLVIPNHGGALDFRMKVETERQRRLAVAPPTAPPAAAVETPSSSASPGDRASQLDKELAAMDEAVRRLRAGQAHRATELEKELTKVDEAMRRVRARMKADGDEAYRRARQQEAAGRTSEAVLLYEQALRLLPPDDPGRRPARERLEALRSAQ
jgi:tetratricopeptide (TPR) repeat protein